MKTRTRFLSAVAAATLAGCTTFSGGVEDLRLLHEDGPAGVLVHRREIERPSPFDRVFPLLGKLFSSEDEPKPVRKEEVKDPARMCRSGIRALREADFDDAEDRAEAAYWGCLLLEKDPSPLSRTDAAVALGGFGIAVKPAPESGPSLEEARVSESLRRALDLRARFSEGDAAARGELAALVRDLAAMPFDRPGVAREITRFLGQLHRITGEREVRDALAEAVNASAGRAVSLALRAGLHDRSEFVREASLEAAVRVEGTAVLPECVFLLKDPSVGVRRRFVRLCAIAPPGSPHEEPILDCLFRGVADPDSSVSTNAMEGLATRTGRPLVLDREAWLDWRRSHEGEPAANRAGGRG